MEQSTALDVIFSYLPPRLRLPLERARVLYESRSQEVTLRVGRPMCIYTDHHILYPDLRGTVTEDITDDLLYVTEEELHDILMKLCDYSVYARNNEINHGYLTIAKGIRVGLCGTAIHTDREVSGMKHITTLSFRIPREVKKCADEIIRLIDPSRGVLVCGPPSSGNTTLIRDMARRLSYRYRVTLADERAELSAPCGSSCGYDVGLSDVYVHMPKSTAIVNSVRSLAPDIIVCDELGDRRDAEAIRYALRCGVSFIATVHAADMDDLRTRSVTASLLAKGAFRYIVFLSGRSCPGKVNYIYEWR